MVMVVVQVSCRGDMENVDGENDGCGKSKKHAECCRTKNDVFLLKTSANNDGKIENVKYKKPINQSINQ